MAVRRLPILAGPALVAALALSPAVAPRQSASAYAGRPDRGSRSSWCAASDLRISADWTVGAGTRAGGVLFTARPHIVCRLRGRPRIDLYVASPLYPGGQRLDVKQHPMPAPSGAKNPAGAVVQVRPDDPAGAQFAWGNWCGSTVLFPVVLRVTVPPRGGRVFRYVRYGSDPRSANAPWCTNPLYPTEFFVDNFRQVTPTDPLPGEFIG